ncbi:unnamed protein product [Fusarium fujikuroi]|nr:unnamed protein product [Fusarium fujikuroi]
MINGALVEVDGLFAGLIYLDATDPPLFKRTSKNWFQNSLAAKLDVICNACETRSENDTPNAPSSTIHEGILARDAAWSSIRTIRDGMQILWDHFVDVSRVLNTPVIDSLRKSYHGAQGLCYEGVFAFRHTVVGQSHDDLVAIFSFCSLSYVITRLLCARNRANQIDIPAGLRSWRDAIKEDDERQAFDALAVQMWPETMNTVHFQPLARSTSTHGHSGSASPVSSIPYQSAIPPTAPDFSSTQSFDGDQQGQELSNIMGKGLAPLQDTWKDNEQVNNGTKNTSTSFSQHTQSLTDLINDAFPLHAPSNEPSADSFAWSDSGSMLDMMEPLDWTAFGDLTSQSAGYTELVTDYTQGLSDTALPETATRASSLQETSTFTIIRDYIRDNCNFWVRLAGSGIVSKDHKSRRLWLQKAPAWMECKRTSSYIQQLRALEHTRNTESRGIIAVAEAYIRWGFLQSVEDVKLYMTKLGDLLFDTETDRQDFCRWIKGFSGDNDPITRQFLRSYPAEMPYLDHYSPLYSYAGGSTRTGVGGLRAAEHLGRALAEVDGLFAGFTHLDETEPESRHSRPNSGLDDLALELDSLCNTSPTNSTPDSQPDSTDPRNQARKNAWASIRTVREGMQILWEHFVDVSHDVNLPAINNIRAEYHDSKGLPPNDHVKIFAFCSLSYVVSRLLYSRGRLAEGDILAGIRLWLNALEDEDERKAFEILTQRLWPEA